MNLSTCLISGQTRADSAAQISGSRIFCPQVPLSSPYRLLHPPPMLLSWPSAGPSARPGAPRRTGSLFSSASGSCLGLCLLDWQ